MNRFLLTISLLGTLFGASAVVASQYETAPPAEQGDEPLSTPTPDEPQKSTPNPSTASRASLPYTPYPAGLSWVMTPQSFRVPIPDRIYYPPHHYVRQCPYYPRGYYWGANWRFNVIGRGNLLFFGTFRYNPYLTAAIARHDPDLAGKRRYTPPPGPVGQAMLLGSSGPAVSMPAAPATESMPTPPPSMPQPPAPDGDSASYAKPRTPVRQATVHKAPEKRPPYTGSSRRTAKPVNLSDNRTKPAA